MIGVFGHAMIFWACCDRGFGHAPPKYVLKNPKPCANRMEPHAKPSSHLQTRAKRWALWEYVQRPIVEFPSSCYYLECLPLLNSILSFLLFPLFHGSPKPPLLKLGSIDCICGIPLANASKWTIISRISSREGEMDFLKAFNILYGQDIDAELVFSVLTFNKLLAPFFYLFVIENAGNPLFPCAVWYQSI